MYKYTYIYSKSIFFKSLGNVRISESTHISMSSNYYLLMFYFNFHVNNSKCFTTPHGVAKPLPFMITFAP